MENEFLIKWAIAARECLEEGAKLMPLDQLRQWNHVGAVLSSFPLSDEEVEAWDQIEIF